MAEAYIYDAVRTPRGRGKPDGSLHEVPAVDLAVTALDAIRRRSDLDPMLVEDVVLGCVDPVGEAGGDIARAASTEHASAFFQHAIAVRMTEPVVDRLEMVEVAQRQCQTRAVPDGGNDLFVQALVKVRAVPQACQAVNLRA